jgi:hypothetical protein
MTLLSTKDPESAIPEKENKVKKQIVTEFNLRTLDMGVYSVSGLCGGEV